MTPPGQLQWIAAYPDGLNFMSWRNFFPALVDA